MTRQLCTQGAFRKTGFTLIEVVIAVGVMVLIGGGIVMFQKGVITNSQVMQSTLISQQQVRKALRLFSTELRSAAPSASGSFAVEAVSTSSITFYANVDSDPAVERVRYFYATSTAGSALLNVLKRSVAKPIGTSYTNSPEAITIVVRDVKNTGANPIFTYYDSTYTGVASSTAPLPQPVSVSTVRLVKMSLAVDPNAARSPVYHTYETQVSIRNLKDNL